MPMDMTEKAVADILAQRVRFIREIRGISSETLAEKADISAVYLSRIENRWVQKVSLYVALRIAQALDVSISELTGAKELDQALDIKILQFKEDIKKHGLEDKLETIRKMLPLLG